MDKPLQIFCCYARKDQSLLLQLKKHLKPLERDGLIVVQADVDVSPGEEWEQKISHYLNTAQMLLLLVSSDFMDSNYCYSNEMQQALARHERGETQVIPILLRPVSWKNAPFANLQALPTDAKPITTWRNRDEAFMDVAAGILGVLKELEMVNTLGTPVKKRGAQIAALPETTQIPHSQTGKELRQLEQDIQRINILLMNSRFEIKQHLFNAVSTFYTDFAGRVPDWVERYSVRDPIKLYEAFSRPRHACQRLFDEILEFLVSQMKDEADKWKKTTMQPLLANRFRILSLEIQEKTKLFIDVLERNQINELATSTQTSMTSIINATLENMGSANYYADFNGILESFMPRMKVCPDFLPPVLLAFSGPIASPNVLNKKIKEAAVKMFSQRIRDSRADFANKLVDELDRQLYELQLALSKALTLELQSIQHQVIAIDAEPHDNDG